jgi:hypothetical protein
MNKLINIKSIGSTLFLFFVMSQVSHAADIPDVAGKTMVARGTVEAKTVDENDSRALKRRSKVFPSDIITTGAKSKAQLRMFDGGMIALKENSELIIAQYKQSTAEGESSVVLDLVQGGLRSITGAIKADKGDYQLNTSIASIGIRGTHYEVQFIDGELWLAVWDGAIDITIEAGINAGNTVSLGSGENFSFGSVDKEGNFNTFIKPPKIFEQGFSDYSKQMSAFLETEQVNELVQQVLDGTLTEGNVSSTVDGLIKDINFKNFPITIHDILPSPGGSIIHDLVAAREGTIEYGDASFLSDSQLSDFSASMEINFDSGEVSNGELSFNENSSRWNAVFNGNMNVTQSNVFLEVDVTHASHDDNIADGDISANFIETLGLDSVVGQFELHEVIGDARVDGSYQVKSR